MFITFKKILFHICKRLTSHFSDLKNALTVVWDLAAAMLKFLKFSLSRCTDHSRSHVFDIKNVWLRAV